MIMNKYLVLILMLLIFLGKNTAQVISQSDTIAPKREFRGVWVATVNNIDWPGRRSVSTDQQKNELLSILDAHQQTGINAIIFQVRPAADAFYTKSREPWSKYLTGKQGKAPEPAYDPLAFAITEAHKRGMELHAWFNPYRATTDSKFAALSADHITRTKPEWFFTYGGIKLFNPGLPDVREYIVQVVLDVVDNYDIDGVHMDDYFYPYHIDKQKINDEETFKQYGAGFSNIKDWRRNNVDLLIKMLTDSIHKHNPRMKFGVSPFGIWANKYQNPEVSDSHGGDSYYELYADSRKWVKDGWVDYVNPQLYRPMNDNLVAFNKMVDWWSNNTYGRHLYIGHAPYRIIENKLPGFKLPTQIPDQIKYLRHNPRVQGSVFFSSRSLIVNPLGVTDSLRKNYYHFPALPPVMLWLDSVAPNTPCLLTLKVTSDHTVLLNWEAPEPAKDKDPVYGYVVYRFGEKDRIDTSNPRNILLINYSQETFATDHTAKKGNKYIYVITAIDRLKNESEHSGPANIIVR